jgi:isoleucyl-tRNA synthetase
MKGYHVERRFGWDTHGLPIEHEIDKKLGISGKDAVMKLGLAKYNEECRAIVMRYSLEWRTTIDRLGRWIDFDNDYKAYSTLSLLQLLTNERDRQWTRLSWNPSGGFSSRYSTKGLCTKAIE